MAGVPRFKVDNPDGRYIAACRHVEDAAALAGIYGPGAKIRDGLNRRKIVWREGEEAFCAADSYDGVAKIVWQRIREGL